MLWPRRTSPAVDGPGAPVDLRTMANLPGRLLFAEGFTGNRMAAVPCVLVKADRSDIVVEVGDTAHVPPPETAVILEVIQPTALLQCFTSVRSSARAPLIMLRTPARPHILQRRRFPRIDLFLGISLHTSENPAEEIASQMINLSVDGAACVLVEPQAPGTRVTLNLAAMGLHPPEVGGTIVRCTPSPNRLWVVGVKFHPLLPGQELYLGKYISDFVDPRNI